MLSMESQPQNPEFRNSPENFHPCFLLKDLKWREVYLLFSRRPGGGLSGRSSDNKDFILLLGSFLSRLLLFRSPGSSSSEQRQKN